MLKSGLQLKITFGAGMHAGVVILDWNNYARALLGESGWVASGFGWLVPWLCWWH